MKIIWGVVCTMLIWNWGCTPGASNAILTPHQLADLKATGRDIIIPHYLPNGFRVKEIRVDRTPPEFPSYAIIFANADNQCFVVEMGTEVGDMIVEAEPTSVIHNPTLGDTAFWNTQEYLGTNWFPLHNNAAYMILGDRDRTEFSRDKTFDTCKRMDSAEFVKVAKSLSVLNESINPR